MKKFVFASILAMAGVGMIAPALYAQDITIKDPAEYNAYTLASGQTDPKAKAAALESFLQSYPASVVKKAVLTDLMQTYQAANNPDQAVSAAGRLLQIDPVNFPAIFMSVYIKKGQCNRTQDASVCDDAATLAKKGLALSKPADVSDADWKNQTGSAFPIFHSAVALDFALAKKDFKSATEEYKQELLLLPPDQTQSGPGLFDTLLLAEAYAKVPDQINAIWFYARAWNFAPAGPKAQIESKLNYWYKKFHGGLDGLDEIKAKAAATVFPAGLDIKPAKTPAEKIHDILVNTPDLKTLALSDKELVLSYGSKEDADKLWAIMKDQQTPVPGVVIEASTTVIKVAVTQDAKEAKVADFVVNLKEPLADKDVPAVGAELKLMSEGGPELDGTYDTYAQVAATATAPQSAQLVLKEAILQAAKAVKKAPVAHKPAAGHKPAAR
jgi:hypothetical protein